MNNFKVKIRLFEKKEEKKKEKILFLFKSELKINLQFAKYILHLTEGSFWRS